MMSEQELIQTTRELNTAQKYNEVIELLNEETLQVNQSYQLINELARAYLNKGIQAKNQQQYDEAIYLISKAIHYNPKNTTSYNTIGNTFRLQKKYGDAILAFNSALAINPHNTNSYYGLGLTYKAQSKYNEAIIFFEKVIENNRNHIYGHTNLGGIYYRLGNYIKAAEFYKKAIKLNPQNASYYNLLGNIYIGLNLSDRALRAYNRAIKIEPLFSFPYYNRALIFYTHKQYKRALDAYEQFLLFSNAQAEDYLRKLAKFDVEELKKIINIPLYDEINELVNKIRDILLYNEKHVTHYTSLSTARKLIVEKGDFRLSECSFLNDTSEGRELFKFLPPLDNSSKSRTSADGDIEKKPFVYKPFIGSFVPEKLQDDLTLWRMYGKEDKEDAKGCSMTIKKEQLIDALKMKLSSDGKNTVDVLEEEFRFYHVVYRKNNKEKSFAIPGADIAKQTQLNNSMKKLKDEITRFVNHPNKDKHTKEIKGLLERIAYLFKTAVYEYEQELRLVVSGNGFAKVIDSSYTLPRVYIELVNLTPTITTITLGPKVERAEEWAAVFHYSLDKDGFDPDIYISHLPFK